MIVTPYGAVVSEISDTTYGAVILISPSTPFWGAVSPLQAGALTPYSFTRMPNAQSGASPMVL